MLKSHIVDINGTFVGAAVLQPNGYRFVAVDVRLDDLDGQVWPTLEALQLQAKLAMFSGSGPVCPPQSVDCRA